MNQLLEQAMTERMNLANEASQPDAGSIKEGSHVWLYIDRVRPGYSRKLAHLWHGPFRVDSKIGDFLVRLELKGTDYRFYPIVHIARLKLRQEFDSRPSITSWIPEETRLDFDEALFPEDSWEPDQESGKYAVVEVLNKRDRKLRGCRRIREYLVKLKGYEQPDWIGEPDLNCGGLIYDFEQKSKANGRFHVMETEYEPEAASRLQKDF